MEMTDVLWPSLPYCLRLCSIFTKSLLIRCQQKVFQRGLYLRSIPERSYPVQ